MSWQHFNWFGRVVHYRTITTPDGEGVYVNSHGSDADDDHDFISMVFTENTVCRNEGWGWDESPFPAVMGGSP